jgi:hypothetical protein
MRTEPLVIFYENSKLDAMHPNTVNYIHSLNVQGWNYKIVGTGEEWKGIIMSKIKGCLEELKKLDPNQYVVVTDARDVFCTRSPKHFMKAVNHLSSLDQMIVSMELFAERLIKYNPNKTYFQVTELSPYLNYHKINNILSQRKYVNAGLICGKAKELIQFYLFALKYDDDQKALGIYMNTFPEKVVADIDAKILHTSGFGVNGGFQNRYQIRDSPSISELLGRDSFFLHLPGEANIKGQKFVYDMVKTILKNFSVKGLDELYNGYVEREFFSGTTEDV